ncbi:hypothetical protein ACFY05_41885 [Microtetraspora fusca]|uniref:Uncharacterized protein n=1 Tax=Microtetraspora fusca TaxID=1997 RepID=A0ABW6VJ52_MICFU
MSETLAGKVLTREERQLATLESTHPAWEIRHLPDLAMPWWAVRRIRPTDAQRAAGVVASFSRVTPELLAAALARFDEIAHAIR